MRSILARRRSSKASTFHRTRIVLARNPDSWRRALVFVALLGAYTNFALRVGVLVFGVFAFLAGGTLALLHLRALHRHGSILVWLVALCLVVDVGGSAFPSAWLSLLQSTLLLIGCIFAGLGVLLELRTWPRFLMRRWLLGGALVVIVLGALEHVPTFRTVSDTVRQILYDNDNQFLYAGDERDLAFHGAIRPKVFTQEPSHPAKFVGVSLAGWHLLSRHRNRTALALAGCALGYVTIRAPSIVVGPAFIAYFAILGGPQRKPLAVGLKLTALAFAFIAMLTFVDWVGFLPGARAQAIANNEDGSIIMRLTGPIAAARAVLEGNPLFGLGIGGKEAAVDTLYSIYSQYDFMQADYHFAQNEEFGWGSGFFQFIAFFGIAGTVLFVFWFRAMCEKFIAPDWPSCLIILVLLMAVDGGFNMVRPWIYFFVLAAVLHVVYRGKILAWSFESQRVAEPPSAGAAR